MRSGMIPIGELRPWWLRGLLLACLGWPMVFGGDLHLSLHASHPYRDLGYWTAYAVMLWLFIFLCVGSRFLNWLAAGAIFGLSLMFGGALLTKVGVWDFLAGLFGSAGSSAEEEEVQRLLDLVFRLLMVLSSFPFFMLVLRSFSAASLFNRAIRRGARKAAMPFIGLAVFLRLFQHVFEVFESLLLAWSEENPQLLLPRYTADLKVGVGSRLSIVRWWTTSTRVWCQALLMHSLLFVPVAVREWQQYLDRR